MITAVTLAELSVGPLVAENDAERAARQAHLQQAEADFDPLPFDAVAARAFGQVAADLRRAGRKASARAYDALIAAIAVARGLPLYTVNPGDFRGINKLELVEIPHPDKPDAGSYRVPGGAGSRVAHCVTQRDAVCSGRNPPPSPAAPPKGGVDSLDVA